jgi:hypothetical protein
MIDERSSDITTTAVYNRLRELGDVCQVPLREEDVALIAKETIKLIKAQHLVKKRLTELGLLKQ